MISSMIQILVFVFVFLLFMGMPVGFAMLCAASASIASNSGLADLIIAQKMNTAMDSFSMLAIPFFMFAGQLMECTGITKSIVKFAESLIGHIRGGMAHASVLTGVIMAGISGSANADASAIGSLMVPTLKESGYDEGYAVSVVSASSILGPIIPPSIFMVIYAGVVAIPINEMFIAGIIPGLLMACGYIICNFLYATKNNVPRQKFAGTSEIWRTFKETIWALIMPIIIIGGILFGIFTATEAGVVASIYGMLYGFFTKKLSWTKFYDCVKGAVYATASPMFVIAVSSVFAYVLTSQNLTTVLVQFVNGITGNPYVVLALFMAIIVILGMFVDPTAGLLMVVPIFVPILQSFGFGNLHIAMILIITLLTGGLTPPVGNVLYIVASCYKTPLEKCIHPIWQFVAVQVLVVVLIIAFPAIVTWLPSLIG